MGVLSKIVKKATSKSADKADDKLGKLFSDPEKTQKGSTDSRKVTKEGLTNKGYTSPSFTKADVFKDQKRDSDIISNKGKEEATTRLGKNAREAAIARAESRTNVRGASAAGALAAGYGAGSLGKEVYDRVKDKEDRVEPSKESKERSKDDDLEKGKDERVNKKDYPTYEKDTKSAEAFRKEFKDAKESGKDSFKFEGREYNTKDKEMNKGGMVGKYAKGGMIKNQGIGASMKPHNMFGKKK
jgi:hypothetical protein